MSAKFLLLTAFSTNPNGGNPAAVVFTDLSQPEEVFKNISQNLNQPITAFVSAHPLPSSSLSNKERSIAFSVRWFTASRDEAALCGHGTLAAAKAIFERTDIAANMEIVELHTITHGVVMAAKRGDGLIEIEFPATKTQEVSREVFTRVSRVLNEASGKELKIDHIATGGEGFKHYAIFVLDEKEDIKNLPINTTLLRETGFETNIYTSQSSNTAERFVSRMFAPGLVPGDEDHVCGSAHCLLTPYWYDRLGISSTTEIKAKQVSARGGDLGVAWDLERNTVKLAGEVIVLGKGRLNLF
ncbi:hypothetical protein H0H87_007001 [Tephrocybe sp. NHM501043]|nr:hypothetical protein H0H87_007001 [Tephrocybe sp. NHM501043]